MRLLPDSFGVAVEVEDGYKLVDFSYILQIINGIVHISLPVLVKVD